MRLKDRVTIITGGASGIGKASAELFAKEGAKVVVADINSKSGLDVVKGIKKTGGEATFVQVDVARAADNRKMVDTAVSSYGKLDILFANAGVAGPKHADTDEAAFRKVLDVNLVGPYLGCLYAVPEMKKIGGGKIIFTASTAGLKGYPRSAVYPASKGGLVLLGRSLARILAKDNIRVNILCPGLVETGLTDAFLGFPTEAERIAASKTTNPIGRITDPIDIAYAALFLVSDESSYVVGTTLVVDGGALA